MDGNTFVSEFRYNKKISNDYSEYYFGHYLFRSEDANFFNKLEEFCKNNNIEISARVDHCITFKDNKKDDKPCWDEYTIEKLESIIKCQ